MEIEGRDCMVITVHDITRLKRVERELKQACEKAENADQIKPVFLSNMSHEISTFWFKLPWKPETMPKLVRQKGVEY